MTLSDSDLATLLFAFITSRLLQCALHMATLENHLEAAAGTECDSPPSDEGGSPGAHNFSPPASLLVPSKFSGALQGAGFDL